MLTDKEILKLYAITDRQYLRGNMTLPEAVELAIKGGAGIIQLREKVYKGDELKKLALDVLAVCHTYDVPLIINDDVELALEIDADGVHVGQSDMEMVQARKILGNDKIIGVTTKTLEQAVNAQNAGADYLGSGAIFSTSTKLDAKPLPLKNFNAICEAVDIPVVAIGGINAQNAAYLKGSKQAGLAVVGGVFDSDDIYASAKKLLEISKSL